MESRHVYEAFRFRSEPCLHVRLWAYSRRPYSSMLRLFPEADTFHRHGHHLQHHHPQNDYHHRAPSQRNPCNRRWPWQLDNNIKDKVKKGWGLLGQAAAPRKSADLLPTARQAKERGDDKVETWSDRPCAVTQGVTSSASQVTCPRAPFII